MNSIRLWQRKNAAEIGRQFSRHTMMYGSNGSIFRVDDDVACTIVERAIARHMRNSAQPTAMRLSLEEAKRFPLFRPSPFGCPVAWLVVVSDTRGAISYALAQEGIPEIDPQLRAAGAKAQAQFKACFQLLESQMGGGSVMGSA